MTDAVILAIIVGVPPTIAAATAAWVAISTRTKVVDLHDNVGRIERQTNSMNVQMTDSARKEGRFEGAVTAAAAASMTPAPALPITIQPSSSDAEIMKWIQQGMAIEKARREGNGPKSP